MSDSDDENYCSYGTPLEPYDEDEFPKKKALTIEEQIATDSQGRRRFHGAFTGGFSAGFCNTVGSLEGWTPSEFKSSRMNKASKSSQKPEDFMDDEDIGEFGIAPTRVRATSDYNMVSSRKRKKQLPQYGPIPGQPVLEMILQPAKETVGVKLLKQMGWKPGQGVGPRLTKIEKKRISKEKNNTKIYGCQIPNSFRQNHSVSSDGSDFSSEEDTEITFAPDDYDLYVYKPKENTFGMGYSGLDKRPILTQFSLFDQASHFSMVDRNNKKVSISGQAFGVGALEDDDEDIYSKDDMSQYDFELQSVENKNQMKKSAIVSSDTLPGFVYAKNTSITKKVFPPPILPKNFIPIHGARKSRFEPLSEERRQEFLENSKKLEQSILNASDRGLLINDTVTIQSSTENQILQSKEVNLNNSNVIKSISQDVNEHSDIKISEKQGEINSSSFKPFIYDADKQERYTKYLNLVKVGSREKLLDLQPLSMTEWERDRERIEFEQAAKMFKPFQDLMFDRFVPAKQKDDINTLSIKNEHPDKEDNDMVCAAKKKMFGKLTREKTDWNPTSLLCKRFNIPEPNIGSQSSEKGSKGKKYSVFDYLQVKNANETHNSAVVKLEQKASCTQDNQEQVTEENKQIDRIENLSIEKKETENKVDIPRNNRDNEVMLPILNLPSSSSSVVNTTVQSYKNKTENHYPLKDNTFTQQNIPLVDKVQNDSSIENITSIVPSDPNARIDLFKAIFLSSSESESEPENNQETENKLDKMKQILIAENYATEEKTKELNVKRNNSLAQGIFKNVDLDAINVRTKNPHTNVDILKKEVPPKKLNSSIENDNIEENKSKLSEDTYGPQLPKQFIKTNIEITNKVITLPFEEWVEKKNESESNDDEDHVVKRKKDKKSHKKHKRHKSKGKHKKHKYKE